MGMAGEFVGLLFMSRDVAHREHLKTRSYAAHMALGDFYKEVIDLADDFAEAYQGKHASFLDIPMLDGSDASITEQLESHVAWINDHRTEICPKSDTAIHNIIDEIVGLYYSTLYKLRSFS